MAKTKVMERKPLTFAEKTFIPQIVTGLKTTLGAMFDKTVTLEYPEQRPVISKNYRGVPTLVRDPNGREKCVSCQLCEFVCPPKAIRIIPGEIDAEAEPDRAHIEKAPKEFEINMLRCIYCGLCEEVCPEEAIVLQDVFSMSGYSREEMINKKDKLYELGGTLPDKHKKWDKKKAAEEAGNTH
ncbi:MAG: NADH-quinone oxidoreductase subunit I [Lentimonas sp.]|jgi:NADH-quinone oxidoreductase subunit I